MGAVLHKPFLHENECVLIPIHPIVRFSIGQHCLIYGLTPNSWQAVIFAYDDLDYLLISTSLGLAEFEHQLFVNHLYYELPLLLHQAFMKVISVHDLFLEIC